MRGAGPHWPGPGCLVSGVGSPPATTSIAPMVETCGGVWCDGGQCGAILCSYVLACVNVEELRNMVHGDLDYKLRHTFKTIICIAA